MAVVRAPLKQGNSVYCCCLQGTGSFTVHTVHNYESTENVPPLHEPSFAPYIHIFMHVRVSQHCRLELQPHCRHACMQGAG